MTASTAERILFAAVKASPLGQAIRGSCYRAGMRPDDARTEDIVLRFLAGTDGQVQTGIVVLNVYIPDLTSGQRTLPDLSRIGEIEELLAAFIDSFDDPRLWLSTDGTPTATPVEGIGQTAVTARIKFRTIE